MYLLTGWGESHSGDAQSCALRLSVCLSLSLFEQKYNSEPQDVANKSFNYCYISLNSFGFNETAFSGAKHLIEKFPSSSCVYILFKHYRLLGNQLEKNNASKHFILSLILFKLRKPVTYDSNYTFYIFGFILNNKPQLGYLNWFFWKTCFIWTVAEQKSTLLSLFCILNQWKQNQTENILRSTVMK